MLTEGNAFFQNSTKDSMTHFSIYVTIKWCRDNHYLKSKESKSLNKIDYCRTNLKSILSFEY